MLLTCKTTKPTTKNKDQYFIVSLYSKGEGIDIEAKNIVSNTIKSYIKKGYDIQYTNTPWGKEGEIDYCFMLQKLKPKMYLTFFTELTTLLKEKQVHIKEKVACRSNY